MSLKTIKEYMQDTLQSDSSKSLSNYLIKNTKKELKTTINYLGEEVLSEEDVNRRVEKYLNILSNKNTTHLALKISTLYSQISPINWEDTIKNISEKLRILLRFCNRHSQAKTITLDMEIHAELQITVEVFKSVLSEPEFHKTLLGIALQAYLPESFQIQKELTEWAIDRVKKGGSPIKIRIVKGANLEMEKIEASQKNWEQAPFMTKVETDAQFKKMILYGSSQNRCQAVQIGIGSHNIFDITFGLCSKIASMSEKNIYFEMLEGMAPKASLLLNRIAGPIYIYCPITSETHFDQAMGYLIRRLSEQTNKNHFLSASFDLQVGSEKWKKFVMQFKNSMELIPTISEKPRKKQNRQVHSLEVKPINESFQNEADTDFSLIENRNWANKIINEWKSIRIDPIPTVIGGNKIHTKEEIGGISPNEPNTIKYTSSICDQPLAETALATASYMQEKWQLLPLNHKLSLLGRIAQKLRNSREKLIGALMLDCAKTIIEADAEVSEAIDFVEYYRREYLNLTENKSIEFKPKGVVVIAPPWNFPCAIATGCIVSALVTGNTVIFKPAPESILVSWVVAQQFWEAGVSQSILQFTPCHDMPIGQLLIQSKLTNCVMLTGAKNTAKKFLNLHPGLHLIAETGGKNAIILTHLSDKELAIKTILHSAFSFNGQKCSAASLVICESDLYHDKSFLEQLKNAVQSLHSGSSFTLRNKITPLISQPKRELLKALTTLEPHETWLIKPKNSPENPLLWTPGIKMGVQQKSVSHQTEFFGPIVSIIEAKDFHDAISIANDTNYGLTAGLISLDEREHLTFLKYIKAGNCYINRNITGAIVSRQPFGGWKESSFGHGYKAGGPHYLKALQTISEKQSSIKGKEIPKQYQPLISKFTNLIKGKKDQKTFDISVKNYIYDYQKLVTPKDNHTIRGQDNFFYCTPKTDFILRVQKENTPLNILRIIFALTLCHTQCIISIDPKWPLLESLNTILQEKNIVSEPQKHFLNRIRTQKYKWIRLLNPTKETIEESSKKALTILSQNVLSDGEFELLNYLTERSESIDFHRFGNLGLRENESKT